MANNKNIVASVLSNNDLALAFSELVAQRWDDWDLTPFMAYLVDTCAPAALPFLADQFDVDGLKGFVMTENEQQQRDVIKQSIALHKFIGTPWAIREACRTVGFPVVVLEEGVTAVKGGDSSSDDWARFRVLVEADVARHITSEEARKLRVFVEFYKNERSHLVELGFYQLFDDNCVYQTEMENLVIDSVIMDPRKIVLNPIGTTVVVKIYPTTEVLFQDFEYDWGNGDKLHIQITNHSIVAESRANITADRQVTLPIEALDGRILGTFIVRQKINWNAYSKAYNKAYNH